MTHEAKHSTGSRERPIVGKDHLNLADWRVSVATYQQQVRANGTKVDFAEYAIHRADGTHQSVTLESPSTIGLPTAAAEDVLIGLLHLAQLDSFAADVVHFVPSRLLRIMHWAETQKSYVRLETLLKQLRAVTVTYRLAWYSRAAAAVQPVLITGILAEANLVLRRGRSPKAAIPESYVQWTKHFYDSLKEGNLTDLDLDLYFGWDRPGAKHLHRHLNKVWHSGRRPKLYERDLKELACGHLGMTDNKDLKRNFQRIVAELEGSRYLAPTDEALRYRKVRPGVWRVRLELHPDRMRTKTAAPGESSATGKSSQAVAVPSAAAHLVREYHRQRFGRDDHRPSPSELRHAALLLADFDPVALLEILPDVARAVAGQAGDDLYFGYAVPLLRVAVAERQHRRQAQQKSQAGEARQADREQITASESERRMERRSQLLLRWRQLPDETRRRYRKQAIDQATSDFVRRRLCRASDLEQPPVEVLDAMAAELALAIGE